MELLKPSGGRIKIGIPKALMYYEHGVLWKDFFRLLNCETVESQDTNKSILDLGVKHCSNETCLPVKVFHGHVLSLKDQADYIFIPRYITLGKDAFCCPKLCGLPDMTLLNLKKSVRLIEVTIDIGRGTLKTQQSLSEIARMLDLPDALVEAAYDTVSGRLTESNPEKAGDFADAGETKIAILGHPYMIYDNYLSMNLIRKLSLRGIRVLTPSLLDGDTKRSCAEPFCEKAFWSMGYDTLGSAYAFSADAGLKGMIYLTPFACGIDSMVTEFIERRLGKRPAFHYMKITMDEHTGEAGFDTRLEAFLDMIPGCPSR